MNQSRKLAINPNYDIKLVKTVQELFDKIWKTVKRKNQFLKTFENGNGAAVCILPKHKIC